MKKKTVVLILIAITLTALLTGCGEKRRLKAARTSAENYVETLKARVSDETLSLTDADAERYGDLLAFTAYSGKYGDDFRIFVNADDSISDSYFALGLTEIAGRAFSGLLESTPPGVEAGFELSVDKNIAWLSGKTFSSIKEAHEALDNAVGLIRVALTPTTGSGISDEALDGLLNAMRESGLYGELSIRDDVRTFRISETGINYTRKDDPPGEVRTYDWHPGAEE